LKTPNSTRHNSLRRGFANWASQSGWDMKTLMQYVGWKSVQSAMRYVDSIDPFAQTQLQNMLDTSVDGRGKVETKSAMISAQSV